MPVMMKLLILTKAFFQFGYHDMVVVDVGQIGGGGGPLRQNYVLYTTK